jgi:hypothetical protein
MKWQLKGKLEIGQKDVATCGRQVNIIARTFPERMNFTDTFFLLYI